MQANNRDDHHEQQRHYGAVPLAVAVIGGSMVIEGLCPPARSVPVTTFGDLPGEAMSTFITTLDTTGTGPRLAVKDIIDVAGVPTTAGSRAVQQTATPATAD